MKLFFVLLVTVACTVGVYAQEFTWQTLYKQTTKTFKGIFVLDENHIWAYTKECTVLITQNGGSTWNEVALDTGFNLTTLHFFDAQHGWIAGDNGYFAKTTDGGSTWIRKDITNGQRVKNIQFLTQQVGFLSMAKLRVSAKVRGIYKTTDGGDTWNQVPTGLTDMNQIYFSTPQTGIAYGIPSHHITVDGGATWNPITLSGTVAVGCFGMMVDTTWFIGAAYNHFELWNNTTKRSYIWDSKSLGDSIAACRFIDTETGAVVLFNKGLRITTNSSKNWETITNLPSESFTYDINTNNDILQFPDANHIYIAATNAIVKGVRKTTSVESETEQLLSISPNPANTTLSITFPVGTTGTWVLTDYLGNQIHSEEYNTNVQPQIVYNSATLANGFYTIRFITNTSVTSQRVIVQH